MAETHNKLEFEVVTPYRRVVAETVDEVVLPSEDGYMGVLPGHAPLLARLQVGQVSYRQGKTQRLLAVSGGYAEVQRDRVTILAETGEAAEEIDVDRARHARERAEAELQAQASELDFLRAEIALKRAINRISTYDRGRSMM